MELSSSGAAPPNGDLLSAQHIRARIEASVLNDEEKSALSGILDTLICPLW